MRQHLLSHNYILYLFIFLMVGCSKRNPSDYITTMSGRSITKKAVDDFVGAYMKSKEMVGISYAIINDGKVVHHNVAGYAFSEKGIKITKETIFEACSMSKSVFGFFVMTFVEDGMLDLDTPVYNYMPVPDPDISDDERYKKITARMLLSHRAGFPNERENETDGKLKFLFDPNTAYNYSGEGYRYLGQVLMHILNTDHAGFEAEFQRRVAQPLGLDHTVFIQTEYTRKNKAEPYVPEGRVDWKNNYFYKKDNGIVSGASSLHSEALDFSKWMIGIMGNRVLSPASYAELLNIQSSSGEGLFATNYTLGFFANQTPLGKLYAHGGNSIGFTSWFSIQKQKKWGVVLFSNSEYGQDLGIRLNFYLTTGMSFGWYYVMGIIFILSLLNVLILGVRKLIFKAGAANTFQQYCFLSSLFIVFILIVIIALIAFTPLLQTAYGGMTMTLGIAMVVLFSTVFALRNIKVVAQKWQEQHRTLQRKVIDIFHFLCALSFILLLIHFVQIGLSS